MRHSWAVVAVQEAVAVPQHQHQMLDNSCNINNSHDNTLSNGYNLQHSPQSILDYDNSMEHMVIHLIFNFNLVKLHFEYDSQTFGTKEA